MLIEDMFDLADYFVIPMDDDYDDMEESVKQFVIDKYGLLIDLSAQKYHGFDVTKDMDSGVLSSSLIDVGVDLDDEIITPDTFVIYFPCDSSEVEQFLDDCGEIFSINLE